MSTTLTIRIDDKIKNRLEKLAKSTARTKSYLVTHAIEGYLDVNEWQVQQIKEAVHEADQPGAEFVEHEDVTKWLDSWGTKKERKAPR